MSYPNDQSNPAGAIPVYAAGASAAHISTATTTLVASGPGTLQGVTISTGGAGSSATIYDSLTGSGTVLAVLSTAAQASVTYGAAFATGLTVVTAGGTPADITVTYR